MIMLIFITEVPRLFYTKDQNLIEGHGPKVNVAIYLMILYYVLHRKKNVLKQILIYILKNKTNSLILFLYISIF